MKVPTKSHTPKRLDAAGRERVWPRMLVSGILLLVLLTPAAGVTGWVLGGAEAAASATAGTLLAVTFLLLGLLGLRLCLGAHEALVLPGVMSVLAFQLLGLLALWTAGRDGTLDLSWIEPTSFGYGALAGALLWQAALVSVLVNTRQSLTTRPPHGQDPA